MDTATLSRLNTARRSRKAVALLTDLDNGQGIVVLEGDGVAVSLQQDVDAAFRSGNSGAIDADGRRYFINVYMPPTQIVIIGAVHISQVLAPMARLAGFDIRIIDPRTAFATPDRFVGTELVADWPVDVLKALPLDAYTALVAVTHDPKIDDFPLAEALRVGCFYVGALGSRKTHATRLERLAGQGIDRAQLETIRAPIGLAIGAANPAEIAASILAEIIQALRSRSLSSAKGDAALS
jgi:xanthine dehydrogenase accessory factor